MWFCILVIVLIHKQIRFIKCCLYYINNSDEMDIYLDTSNNNRVNRAPLLSVYTVVLYIFQDCAFFVVVWFLTGFLNHSLWNGRQLYWRGCRGFNGYTPRMSSTMSTHKGWLLKRSIYIFTCMQIKVDRIDVSIYKQVVGIWWQSTL